MTRVQTAVNENIDLLMKTFKSFYSTPEPVKEESYLQKAAKRVNIEL